jgi:hypothetical protein
MTENGVAKVGPQRADEIDEVRALISGLLHVYADVSIDSF